MKRFCLAAAVAVALAAGLSTASAHAGGPVSGSPWFSVDLPANCYYKWGKPLPTFQAAPWYLYWPYDAHFQTPAPVFAGFAPPPTYPLPYNPYNPGFAYVQGGHPVAGHGGTGWPPIPTPHR
jgi:hypothetical protein